MFKNPSQCLYAILLVTIIPTISSAKQPIVCKQEYAICTSAECIPDPRQANFALCSCDVKTGNSAGYKHCNERKPFIEKNKTKHIVSTFSFVQFKTHKAMVCPKGFYWTNCVDSPCTINPMNTTKATCSCPVMHGTSFVTFGGNCDTKNCSVGFWSGATLKGSQELREIMQKLQDAGIDSQHNVSCPAN